MFLFWIFCNHFSFILSHLTCIVWPGYPAIKFVEVFRDGKSWKFYSSVLTSSTQLQRVNFHVVDWTRTAAKCREMENARARRAKVLPSIVKYVDVVILAAWAPQGPPYHNFSFIPRRPEWLLFSIWCFRTLLSHIARWAPSHLGSITASWAPVPVRQSGRIIMLLPRPHNHSLPPSFLSHTELRKLACFPRASFVLINPHFTHFLTKLSYTSASERELNR